MAYHGRYPLKRLHAEIAQVLDWAHATFPGQRAPLDEATRKFTRRLGQPGEPRHAVTLSISGGVQFCQAFRQRFGL